MLKVLAALLGPVDAVARGDGTGLGGRVAALDAGCSAAVFSCLHQLISAGSQDAAVGGAIEVVLQPPAASGTGAEGELSPTLAHLVAVCCATDTPVVMLVEVLQAVAAVARTVFGKGLWPTVQAAVLALLGHADGAVRASQCRPGAVGRPVLISRPWRRSGCAR